MVALAVLEAAVVKVPVAAHGDGRSAICKNNRGLLAVGSDTLEEFWLCPRKTSPVVQTKPMAARGLLHVGQLSLRSDLRHAFAAMDKVHLAFVRHHDSGTRMRYGVKTDRLQCERE